MLRRDSRTYFVRSWKMGIVYIAGLQVHITLLQLFLLIIGIDHVTLQLFPQTLPDLPTVSQTFQQNGPTSQLYGTDESYNSDTRDHFEIQMCRERKHRINWQEILSPCKGSLKFSSSIYSKMRTKADSSQIINKDIRSTGEYSSFRIKTFDYTNMPKIYGGDTWRVYIKGESFIEPYVYDLNNGEYDVSFLLLEPGNYTAAIVMEGSLCSSFVNPPDTWFKKGEVTLINILI